MSSSRAAELDEQQQGTKKEKKRQSGLLKTCLLQLEIEFSDMHRVLWCIVSA
jgi:hypothetical protein